MTMKRHWLWALGAALCIAGASPRDASAAWPEKPVRLITQGAAGSGPDTIARILAEQLARTWNVAVPIVNMSGGAGIVAGRAAAGAEPDGYTLYVPTITTFVILPELHDNLPFDLQRDFTPVGFLAEIPMLVAVASSVPVHSLPELVALAKGKPGELFYAGNNRGSLPHLTGELLASRTGASLRFVPYAGAAAGLQDVMGGRVTMIVESAGALSGAVQAGSIRPLGVTSPRRLPSLPDVPAVAETVPGFVAIGWVVLMAPASTPAAIVSRINQDLNAVLLQPDVAARLQELGAFARPMSSLETARFIRDEQVAWRPLVRTIDLKSR